MPLERQREVLDVAEFLEGKARRASALNRMLAASEDAVVAEGYVAEIEHMRLAD